METPDGPIVLGQADRKMMCAITASHKVQIVRVGRVQGGPQGGQAGVGNRARRQAMDHIRVIRCRGLQVVAGEVSVKILDAVDNGRVTLESDASAEPIVDHRRDQRAFGGLAGLFFNNRGQGNDLVQAQSQFDGPALQGQIPGDIKTGDHPAQDFSGRIPNRELIGGRVEIAFEAVGGQSPVGQELGVGIQTHKALSRAESPLFEQPSDLHQTESLGNRDGPAHELALPQPCEQSQWRERLGKQVFSGLDVSIHSAQTGPQAKDPDLVQHAFGVQVAGDGVQWGAVLDKETDGLRQRWARCDQSPIAEPSHASADQKRHKQADQEQGALCSLACLHSRQDYHPPLFDTISAAVGVLDIYAHGWQAWPCFSLRGGCEMGYDRGVLRTGMAHGHIQLLILPILVLFFLGSIVRSASSAVDHRLEKQKVIEQLQQRLSEVRKARHPSLLSQSEEFPDQEFVTELPAVVALAPAVEQGEQRLGEVHTRLHLSPILQPEELPAPELAAELPGVSDASPSSPAVATVAPPVEQLSQPHSFPFQTTYTVRKNDTFETILRDQGIKRGARANWITAWIAAAKKDKRVRNLQIGQRFSFVFAEGSETPMLASLSYETGALSQLTLERTADGTVTARTEKLPTSVVWRATAGRITSSLYEAAVQNADVPRRIVDEMVDLGWDLDFFSDLRAGDIFKVIFEEYQRDGQPVQYGRIIAAEIVNKGKVLQALLPTRDQGFLYPLKYTRISSVFTTARFHPILKRHRPHNGVDFAAPRGTPVRAVADGTITYSGRESGFGRLIRIDHSGGYRTEYAHLDRIAKGIRVGERVKRGQQIGRVGSTGLATGPHLHFGLVKNGRYVNPLKNLARAASRGDQQKPNPAQAELKKTLTAYLAQLDIGQTAETRVFAAVATDTTKPTLQPRS